MAVTHLPHRPHLAVSARTAIRVQRLARAALLIAVAVASVTLALILGEYLWHAMLEAALLTILFPVVGLIARHSIAIFRDEP